jgi:Na+-transporting NADH:ubiquinone oxidoreductase subunit NqrF
MKHQLNEIIVIGKASAKIVKTILIPKDHSLELTLMDFLQQNGITVASSCNGVGACQKCLVNKSLLSCQITLDDFMNNNPERRVEISYL